MAGLCRWPLTDRHGLGRTTAFTWPRWTGPGRVGIPVHVTTTTGLAMNTIVCPSTAAPIDRRSQQTCRAVRRPGRHQESVSDCRLESRHRPINDMAKHAVRPVALPDAGYDGPSRGVSNLAQAEMVYFSNRHVIRRPSVERNTRTRASACPFVRLEARYWPDSAAHGRGARAGQPRAGPNNPTRFRGVIALQLSTAIRCWVYDTVS